MDKINKLTLPATILIASIILGGFYYASQVNKQKSIERQQQVELKAETERQDKIKREETTKQLNLSICLETADSDYWNYMKLNGTTKADGTITAPTTDWDRAEKVKQNAIDNCYKQYK